MHSSTTKGFRELVHNSKYCTCVFLLIAALFTLAFFMMILGHLHNAIEHQFILFMVVFVAILIGACSSITLFIASHLFLQRILDKWKNKIFNILDDAFIKISISEENLGKIKEIMNLKKAIDNDKIKYNFGDIISAVFSLVAIIFNVLSILNILGNIK